MVICWDCKKEALPGLTRCKKHRAECRKANHKYIEKNRDKIRERYYATHPNAGKPRGRRVFYTPEEAVIMRKKSDERYEEKMEVKCLIEEYHILLGSEKLSTAGTIRLEALAEYFGRDIEEWRSKKMKDAHIKKLEAIL